MQHCGDRHVARSALIAAVQSPLRWRTLPQLLRRPRDALHGIETNPHPGPLPSDGRGRTDASLVVNPAVSSVRVGQPFWKGLLLMEQRILIIGQILREERARSAAIIRNCWNYRANPFRF